MSKENCKTGAFLFSRSIFNSDIWFMPPEYFKIWFYLVGKAAHTPIKSNGYTLQRGQCFVTYKEIGDQLTYRIGYRKHESHEGAAKRIMKYLSNEGMNAVTNVPRGLIVDVLNYNYYQDLKNYERTDERTDERNDERTDEQKKSLPPLTRIRRIKELNKKERGGGTPPAPPALSNSEILLIFKNHGYGKTEADKFTAYYEARTASINRFRSIEAAVENWIKRGKEFSLKNENTQRTANYQHSVSETTIEEDREALERLRRGEL